MQSFRSIGAIALACALQFPVAAFAWGADGHRMINQIAAKALPPSVPAFLRTPAAVAEIEALGPEEDRLKDAGTSWDDDNDPGHYVDIGDDGTIDGVSLDALPKDMRAYAVALGRDGKDPYGDGYLPYNIIDGYEQIRKDFAIWRVDDYGAKAAADAAARLAFANDLALRETLTLRDIGVYGHFVGDGSQPLHVTIHYNGWGKYPNPKGYSDDHHLHAFFESEFVRKYARPAAVQDLVGAYAEAPPSTLLSQAQIATLVTVYLRGSASRVTPLYDIEAAHGFASGSPAAVAFVDAQLARGASMLRDIIVLAWDDSLNAKAGYPAVDVRDVLSGKATIPPPAGND